MPDSADEIERRLQANEDPYLDPRWGVLANKVQARTQRDLDAAENDMVEFRSIELAAHWDAYAADVSDRMSHKASNTR